MAVDFSKLLETKFDDVKRPPVKPPGTYYAIIADHKFDVSSQKKTPYCRFTFANVTPGPDVDQSLLKDEEGAPIDLSTWKPSTRGLSDFYLTPDSLFRLKEFMEALKIEGKGRSLQEMIPETRGLPVMLTVSMQQSQDGKGFFNQIDAVAPVE